MNKLIILPLLLLQFAFPIRFSTMETSPQGENALPEYLSLYYEMNLEDRIELKAFEQAYMGYLKLDPKNKEYITLIDYSKPSTKARFFVLDLQNKEVLYESHVLHGRNSGYAQATSFSNEMGSNKSSLGFFITEKPYYGKYGYALRMDGKEKGINDKARQRAIVIHASRFADPKVMLSARRLPRSLGCPAIPQAQSKEIINTIKDGSLVYIYADNEEYENKSKIIPGRMAS